MPHRLLPLTLQTLTCILLTKTTALDNHHPTQKKTTVNRHRYKPWQRKKQPATQHLPATAPRSPRDSENVAAESTTIAANVTLKNSGNGSFRRAGGISKSHYVSPLSAYQDPNWGETEEKDSEWKVTEGEEDKTEETTATEPRTEEAERWEIDLNEMAKRQGLMTDDEFQSILDGGNKIVINPEGMAEVLDLASQAVGEGETAMGADESEGVVYQPEEEMREGQTEEAKQTEEERREPETHQSVEKKEI